MPPSYCEPTPTLAPANGAMPGAMAVSASAPSAYGVPATGCPPFAAARFTASRILVARGPTTALPLSPAMARTSPAASACAGCSSGELPAQPSNAMGRARRNAPRVALANALTRTADYFRKREG